MSTYEEYLARKLATPAPPTGIVAPSVSPTLYPFQRDIVESSLERSRSAILADCGLGKGPMLLEWARQVADHTKGRVIVLAPLAVAKQLEREASKFGIDGAEYARAPADSDAPILITNYERLAAFDDVAVSGVVLDESSVLKGYMSKTKLALMARFEETPYKLCCTATPAPNDHLELGNHAEFLGVMTSHEMIARWFINDTSTFGTYRLKRHAVPHFWRWVCSWARCLGRPSDIGPYEDVGYELPPLKVHRHVVEVDVVEGRTDTLFRIPDMSATAIHKEKRRTAKDRAARIAELVATEPDEQWLVWCETDYESDELKAAMPEASEVRGSQSLDVKERRLCAFLDGDDRVLITKPKIAGFGVNLQNVARMAFVGASYSYEAYYQAVRRAWRFGQKRPVDVHVALGSTELDVWSVLQRKADDHESMKAEMFKAARAAQHRAHPRAAYTQTEDVRFPEWLKTA